MDENACWFDIIYMFYYTSVFMIDVCSDIEGANKQTKIWIQLKLRGVQSLKLLWYIWYKSEPRMDYFKGSEYFHAKQSYLRQILDEFASIFSSLSIIMIWVNFTKVIKFAR